MELAMLAIRPLLPKLGGLLTGEFTLEKRVRKGVESLEKEMMLMQAALGKVAKVPPEQLDDGVKIWAGMVRDLAYQMEDIVDAFMVRVDDGSANPKNRVKKLIKTTCRLFKKGKDLHQISDALEEVIGQAKHLAELHKRYKTPDTGAGASIDPRIKAMYTHVNKLVGIEEPRDKLINMLIQGDDWLKSPLKTVSVVGFGGLGKTTLAKTVYDKIKVQFDCGAFVSVSRNPDMKKILKDILFELDKNKYSKIYNAAREVSHLIDELIEFLNDKRYLIVIDDIWDENAWQLIKCALSENSNSLGSRLITTTRIFSVSEACCSSTHDIYRMKPLSDDVSRRLFYKRVFSPGKECPHELVEVSEHILKKCGGVPLAVITIASLLASNHRMETKDQWDAVLNSIGRGLTEDRSAKEMKKILLFSYYDLPSYLKPCLLYLSVFPEDHKIMRGQLILKWISEGFVYSEEEETSLYELGDRYFNELVNRSMIQPIGIDREEKVEACRVHDMVLDLICSLASEENFVTILDGTKRKMLNSQSKVRRLSIQNSKIDVATSSMAQVRSITFFTNVTVDQLQKISSCQVLRVLDLKIGKHPIPDTSNFLHLRHLRLKYYGSEELPVEIGKLRFLQVLDIKETSIKEMPSSVVRLRRLTYLIIGLGTNLPSGIGNLTSLEVLDRAAFSDNINHHLVRELYHLTKLRVLRFRSVHLDESMCKTLVESLSKLHKLEILDIQIQDGDLDESMCKTLVESLSKLHKLKSLDIEMEDGRVNLTHECWVPTGQLRRLYTWRCPFRTLPAWINPSLLPLLSYLSIEVSKVQSADIQLLGMLHALRFLSLNVDGCFSGEHVVEMSVVTADAFPCVTDCYLNCIAAVPSIFPRGAAPRLESIRFSFPARWVSRGDFDSSMGHLPSLEDVSVDLWCEGASPEEVEEADAALRAAAEDHPNLPDIEINWI